MLHVSLIGLVVVSLCVIRSFPGDPPTDRLRPCHVPFGTCASMLRNVVNLFDVLTVRDPCTTLLSVHHSRTYYIRQFLILYFDSYLFDVPSQNILSSRLSQTTSTLSCGAPVILFIEYINPQHLVRHRFRIYIILGCSFVG